MVRTLLSVGLAVVLSACRVDLQIDVVMRDDGSGVVTVSAVADADVVKRSPKLAADLRFDDVKAAGWTVAGPTPTQSGGLEVVLTHAFATPEQATALLAGVGGGNGPLVGITLGRSEAGSTTTYTLNGTLQVTGGLEAFSDSDLLGAVGATPYAAQLQGVGLQPADAVGLEFSATLPGSLKATTAASGRSLRWTVPLDGAAIDVATRSQTEDRRNAWAGPVARGAKLALVGWLVISVGFIVYVVLARRRRRIANQPWY